LGSESGSDDQGEAGSGGNDGFHGVFSFWFSEAVLITASNTKDEAHH
jgi:hypothetical protein